MIVTAKALILIVIHSIFVPDLKTLASIPLISELFIVSLLTGQPIFPFLPKYIARAVHCIDTRKITQFSCLERET